MNLSKLLIASLLKQDIAVNSHDEVPFNIHLTDNISYFFCFLIAETEKYVVIVETTLEGREELRIIVKKNIISIDVLYNIESIFSAEPRREDVMFS